MATVVVDVTMMVVVAAMVDVVTVVAAADVVAEMAMVVATITIPSPSGSEALWHVLRQT